MTEEIILAIKEAEEQALLEKQAAITAAEKILETAQSDCLQLEQATAAVCKAYKESGKKAAETLAQQEYEKTVQEQENRAKQYCSDALKEMDSLANKVVGRIIRGDY